MKFRLFVFSVILLSSLSVGRSLHFSLAGDDWLALYRYITTFNTFTAHFQFSNYIGNYDAANILMGLIYNIFEYNPFPYYFLSLVLRILAAISFYPTLYSLTKNRLIPTLAGILFATSYGGIETTNWVFNMTTYLSITLLNLFLWNYVSTFKNTPLKDTLLQSLLLFLAFYFTPNRMHGLVFIIPFLELLKIKRLNLQSISISVFRMVLFIIPILLFRHATANDWDTGYLSAIPNLQTTGFSILFYPITNIGSILFPDNILNILISNYSQPKIYEIDTFLFSSFSISLVYISISYLLSFSVKQKIRFFQLSLLGIVIFNVIFWISLQQGKINNFGNLITFVKTQVGGYTLIIISIYFYFQRRSYPILASTGAISLFFTISFLIAPWLAFNGDFPSEHRYLSVSTATLTTSIAIFFAILLNQKNKVSTNLIITLVILLFAVNFLSLQLYFNNYLSHGRRADYVANLFKQLVSQVDPPENNKPLVFLFLTDNQFNLYNSIGFGFDTHFMLVHPLLSKNLKNLPRPIIADNMESLISILKDPNSSELKRYGHQPTKIPLENVYSFYLKEDKLFPNTDQLRKELSILLER